MTMVTVTSVAADEELLLDLLNSTPMTRGVESDKLEQTIAWRTWLDTDGAEAEGRQALTAVRSALQSVVRGDQTTTALEPFLRGIHVAPAVTDSGIEWSLEGRTLLPARIVMAWDAVSRSKPGRLRACANDECHLFLLDRSKANTGRWCSMQSCGNRMKARRHYSQQS
ncbi:CGNR zinc finger domain-containing protein [Kribbella sp. NBC_01505]|uniref:CGNR zinc finger domain-containing protein n=1 Tax=Kribbella sp. NBC_01505 TaxID=2903580 RepID=UPI00386E0BB8